MLKITPIAEAGTWTITRPSILEVVVQGNRLDFDSENDPNLARLIRGRRIVLFGLATTTATELGLGRGHEGTEANDTYLGTIKAPNQHEAESIFMNLREIFIAIPPTEIYNRIEILNVAHLQRKAAWFITFDIIAYRKGRPRVKD